MSQPDRMMHDKATILAIIKYFLITAVVLLLIYLGFRIFAILLPFVFGFILARLAIAIVTSAKNLVYDLGEGRKKRRAKRELPQTAETSSAAQTGRRKLGRYPQGLARSRGEKRLIIFVYILLIILIIGLFVGIILAVISQLRSLAAYLPVIFNDMDIFRRVIDYLESLSEKLGGLIQPQQLEMLENELVRLQQNLLQKVPEIVAAILNGIAGFAANLPLILFAVVVAIMSGYYFIADSRSMYVFLRRNVISKQFRETTVRLINTLFSTLFRVIGGYLLLLIVTFIMALVGLLIIQMPYAVIIALVASIVDFLPVLGLGATLVPVALYLFLQGQLLSGLGALILLGVMTLVRRVIEPPILGNAMRLHPMATLASMIIGIAVYGVAGILFGPIIMVIGKEVLTLYGIDTKLRAFLGDLLNRIST
ncbi:MAG: AI-2E family transporter [Eubacteriales bacterium]|mgnify:CR=1 FL=1|nr:AI-2E family transporter [Clostridiales bacterium]MDD2441105.1 AI-2E family transporter [Eubacteriales bacterium]MDD4138756.1 AI-2E family transporter [Eubacteriales bacterium]MDD4743408.1 AI-2E family transporter [Eubacteriales bacterium]